MLPQRHLEVLQRRLLDGQGELKLLNPPILAAASRGSSTDL